MKKLLTLLFVSLCMTAAFAQQDATSAALLNNLSAKYKNSTGTRIQLKITVDDSKTQMHQTINGTLTTKGRKFHLVTPAATMLFDGKTLYTYSKQSNEVTISEPEEEEVKDLDPTAVLGSYNPVTRSTNPKREAVPGTGPH